MSSATFEARRVTLARRAAGMSKRELADALAVSPASVTQYEAGRTVPRRAVIARMALTLGCPAEYFFDHPGRREPVAVSAAFFRSLRATRLWEREQAEAYAEHVWDLVSLLEHHLELPAVGLPDCGAVGLDAGRGHVEETAASVRAAWQLPAGPIGHVVRSLETHGILVTRLAGGSNRMDAFSRWLGDRPLVMLWSHKADGARSRFDAAHELGHLVMHPEPEAANQILERQAHRFAAAFLMPADEVEPELPRRPPRDAEWEAIDAVRRRWGVSIQSWLYRAREVGTLSDAGYRRALIRLSERGTRRHESGAVRTEQPALLQRAVDALCDLHAWDLDALARALSFSRRQLLPLLGSGVAVAADIDKDETVTDDLAIRRAARTRA